MQNRVMSQKETVLRLDSPALAALYHSADTDYIWLNKKQISSSFTLLEQHRTPTSTTELNFTSDKRNN